VGTTGNGLDEVENWSEVPVIIRCTVDGLLLRARMDPDGAGLRVSDGGEAFRMEALEALLYEVVCATCDELLALERAHYRLLRKAEDFTGEPDAIVSFNEPRRRP
jgi:hypothetical protein